LRISGQRTEEKWSEKMTTMFDAKFEQQYGGGQCVAISCGSKNPVAAMFAMEMLKGMNNDGLDVTKVQPDTVDSQLAGLKLASGIQLS
jgi:hypothetical protein